MKRLTTRCVRALSIVILPIGTFFVSDTILLSPAGVWRSTSWQKLGTLLIISCLVFVVPICALLLTASGEQSRKNRNLILWLLLSGAIPVALVYVFFVFLFGHD